MTVHNSVSNSHDDYNDNAFHSSNSNSIGRKLFTESSLSPSSSFSPSFDIAEGFFKDGRKVHIAHLSEAASRSWRFYLDHLIAAVEHFTGTAFSECMYVCVCIYNILCTLIEIHVYKYYRMRNKQYPRSFNQNIHVMAVILTHIIDNKSLEIYLRI